MGFWATFVLLSVVGAVVGLAIRLMLPRVLAWRGVWFTWRTRFGAAMVFDSADADGTTVRLLNVNGTFQSVCYVDDDLLWDPVCEYHRTWARLVHVAWPLRAKARRTDEQPEPHRALPVRHALIMGGGGYSFPKWLVAYRPDFCCTTVEIDPKITNIAKERLFLDKLIADFNTQQNGRLNLVCDDAWHHLLGSDNKFDLIVNDAFGGNRPLGNMDTREGAAHIRRHLHEDGVYIGNVRTPLEGRRAQALQRTRDAFAKEFNYVWVFPERPEDPRRPGNNALVACNRALDLGTINVVQWQAPTPTEG